jgi:hypothetical protein
MLANPFETFGSHFPILRNHFQRLGNHFPNKGRLFVILGKLFVILGNALKDSIFHHQDTKAPRNSFFQLLVASRPGEDGSIFFGSSSPMNQSSTRWRAHGVLRRNVRLDLTVGLNWKQRTGMRRPISPQPCRWTSWLRICSSVTPCNGSRGCDAGDVMR